jgi:hypothetical protein
MNGYREAAHNRKINREQCLKHGKCRPETRTTGYAIPDLPGVVHPSGQIMVDEMRYGLRRGILAHSYAVESTIAVGPARSGCELTGVVARTIDLVASPHSGGQLR